MKILFAFLATFGFFGLPYLSPVDNQTADHSDLGIVLQVPDSWQSNALLRTTRKKHYAVQGMSYEEADSNDFVHGFIHYSDMVIDSTLLPSSEAYDLHNLIVEMHGYFGWYRRWLWSQGKQSLFEHYGPHQNKEDVAYVLKRWEVLDDQDERKMLENAYAIEYEVRQDSSHAGAKGQIYWLARGDRCFKIVVEGLLDKYDGNRIMYEEVLQSIEFVE